MKHPTPLTCTIIYWNTFIHVWPFDIVIFVVIWCRVIKNGIPPIRLHIHMLIKIRHWNHKVRTSSNLSGLHQPNRLARDYFNGIPPRTLLAWRHVTCLMSSGWIWYDFKNTPQMWIGPLCTCSSAQKVGRIYSIPTYDSNEIDNDNIIIILRMILVLMMIMIMIIILRLLLMMMMTILL